MRERVQPELCCGKIGNDVNEVDIGRVRLRFGQWTDSRAHVLLPKADLQECSELYLSNMIQLKACDELVTVCIESIERIYLLAKSILPW